ncbi:MAG: phosphohydrolase [Chloroflexi bacterium]|nr:phosphohydrolase [Chloroflexota bacterium]MBK6709575.1 phosphohydrolase [Chloroflexota bacterium]MBK7180271.1 phosphohydrolase [Chloroflexota bacterium]MBK8934174.1 phosphohydrolase [Chloroflexota bacterium]MBP7592116.1 phosphohydrolase [Chloroflexota bacterium]
MTSPNHQQAITYAYKRLQRELSPKLTYHTLWHTQEDVVLSCLQIAHDLHIAEEEMRLLEVSAAFHDIGFIVDYANHELNGVHIAAEVLPDFGYSEREIALVTGMILATRLPQSPTTLLQEILADADFSVLGREDFFERNQCLKQELANYGRMIEEKAWYETQLALLESHEYFTEAAKKLRDPMKREHIISLKKMLQSLA